MVKSLKSVLIATVVCSSLLASVSSFAADTITPQLLNDPALKITSFSIQEVEPQGIVAELPTLPTGGTGSPIDEVSMVIDGLLAIGKKIWPIIDAGRPVINNKLAPSVSVIPHLEGENGVLSLMANWSVPHVKSFRVSYKNGFNMEVVGFTYTVLYQSNGDLNGVGKYITGLKIQASEITAAWGFNFDAASELVSIANIGSQKAPVASAVLQISYSVRGNFQVLNN